MTDETKMPTDYDGELVTPERLAAWLDAKFARHGEEEDKWAADYIRTAADQVRAAVLAERERVLNIIKDWFEFEGVLIGPGKPVAHAIRSGHSITETTRAEE